MGNADSTQHGGISQHVDRNSPRTAQAQEVTPARAIARWRAADGLAWKKYDDSDEWIVFNPASGDIHLLSDSAHRLWILTGGDRPLTTEELIASLLSESGALGTDEFLVAARESIESMDRAGLVRLVLAQ